MTLLAEYQAAVDKGKIEDNPIQRQVLPHLQRIDKELKSRPFSWIKLGAKRNVRGLYLSGPVGVGKTFLLDLFYQHASVKKALLHFHHFKAKKILCASSPLSCLSPHAYCAWMSFW